MAARVPNRKLANYLNLSTLLMCLSLDESLLLRLLIREFFVKPYQLLIMLQNPDALPKPVSHSPLVVSTVC